MDALLGVVLLAGAHAPAVVSPLTLHGVPIRSTVDVYRVARPIVEPVVVEPEQLPSERDRRSSSFILVGTLIGAGTGCPIGIYMNSRGGDADETQAACMVMGALGAGVGALIGAASR